MTRPNISKYCTYAEATKSDYAIRKGLNNTPNSEQLQNMANIATKIFDPVRDWLGKPLAISSFYRSPEVNKAIGGANSSQHCQGEAIDIDCDIFGHGSNGSLFRYIKENFVFDQLLWEYGDDNNPDWVHVSLKREGVNRMQCLRVVKSGGKTNYIKY
jgi:hypothetical protein